MSVRGDGPRVPWEVPLVRSDNAAAGAVAGRDMWLRRSDEWPAVLQLYWDGIWRTIEGALRATADRVELRLLPTRVNCTFQSVETYWDFIEPNAVEFVSRMISDLQALAPRVDIIWSRILPGVERPSPIEFHVESNSPRVTLRLRSDETLKIYAKTHIRVRFEFEQKDRQLGDLIGGRQFETLPEFPAKLMSCTHQLAERFRNLLSALSRIADLAGDQRPAHEFIHAIVDAVSDRELHETIISLLVREGRIVRERGRIRLGADRAREFQDRLQAAIDDLRRREILVVANSNASHWTTLVPAPQYRQALTALRGRPEP